MKFIFSILILFSIVFATSCARVPNLDHPAKDTEEVLETDAVEQKTITGSFRSVSGVMNELSCYCSNGGYVTTEDGSEVAVCFNADEEVPSCDKITVTGYMTSKKIESNGVCPGGMMGFLKVQTYTVGETDH
jgi:hypothetical protein